MQTPPPPHSPARSLTRPLALPPAPPPACHDQGIVPCKAGVMAGRLTDIVEDKLLSVPEVFGRLEPDKVAELMTPGVNQIAEQVVSEMLPTGGVNGALLDAGKARLRALPAGAAGEL